MEARRAQTVGMTFGHLLDMALEGSRMVGRGFGRKLNGRHRVYSGNANEICSQIVERCFHRKKGYFRTSPTTYTDFWARDFGRCVPSLLGLGYREEVISSYRYALRKYEKRKRFALIITPKGRLFDFPYYAPDGFAFFLRGLTFLDDPELVNRYRPFLERELRRFVVEVVDTSTGSVRQDRFFSEAQDYTKRASSCYSTVMCHLTRRAADALDLENPLAPYDYREIIEDRYWNGDHFWDDAARRPYVSGDACVTPFFADAVPSPEARFQRVLARMDEEGLTWPYLARYGNTAEKNRPMIRLERFHKWQRNTVWPCLGLQLLEVLRRFDKNRYRHELAKYESLVETLGCFPEVLVPDPDPRLFAGPFYKSDDSMLWAADLLYMLRQRDGDLSNG